MEEVIGSSPICSTTSKHDFDLNFTNAYCAGNRVETSAAGGIGVRATTGAIITNNYLSGAGAIGIDCHSTSTGVRIIGNRVISPTNQGIFAQAADAIVEGNYITGGSSNISVSSTRCIVKGNIGTGATSTTLSLNGAHDTIVEGNTFDGGADTGISVTGSTARAIVHNNRMKNFTTVARYGISIGATAVDTTVTNNYIHDGSNGINCNSGTTGYLVEGNRLLNITSTKIAVGSTSGTIRRNIGYTTENSGTTSVADGGTISHGLSATPTTVRVTPSTSGEFVSVTAIGATTFTVAIKKHDGTAGTTANVYWQAEV